MCVSAVLGCAVRLHVRYLYWVIKRKNEIKKTCAPGHHTNLNREEMQSALNEIYDVMLRVWATGSK